MKKLIFISTLFFAQFGIITADEGMWLPQLLEATGVYAKMKKAGCKLSPEQIYSVNKACLKDAIVLFGGGCTAEIISDKGLILTNHHCGYSSIVAHSTVQKNYLKNGYWAKTQNEELYTPNLTASIVVRIEDVTKDVLKNISSHLNAKQKDSVLQHNANIIIQNTLKNTNYNAVIKPYSYELQYFLIVFEQFKDVRLVAAPPEHIGKFGGEDDNWVWPRHNADFSMFRIYTSKDNKPADYSPDNVPYKPKYVIPISIKGCKENDFTMVYGFPGRTQEYLSSYAIDVLINNTDPMRVRLREKRLTVMAKYMKQSSELNLKYANTYASVANYYKKWKGEMNGLKKFNAVEQKSIFEKKFLQSLKTKPTAYDSLSHAFKQFQEIYPVYAKIMKHTDYYQECFMGIDAIRYSLEDLIRGTGIDWVAVVGG